MKVELNIPDQDIIDIMVTALEGGSNYWYNLPNTSAAKKYNDPQFALSELITKAVLEHDEKFQVYDIEDEDTLLGEISQENFKRGLQMFLDDDRIWTPDMDAEQADVFFQFVVMGEIVYG